MHTTEDVILHITTASDWQAALDQGTYRCNSLDTEGFIHCSKLGQILTVANHYYPGQQGLVLLWIAPDRLTADLRWEPASGDVFPHIYGALNLDAVLAVSEFSAGADGTFQHVNKPAFTR
ncbi:MAG: DUF952 domain-containing protein [Anaerolineales bacterium]|jgi:uncharacterized protein (DUF952 family)